MSRVLIELLDGEFARLHQRSCRLVEGTSEDNLYSAKSVATQQPRSIGVNILRSAAAVEQTCGGINSNLWDDPFEWTLPEQLSTPQLILEYLDEVEATRIHCFARFRFDSDLFKDVMSPSDQAVPLVSLLLNTLVRASSLQGQALAESKSFSE
jgi:hypothetical protein